MFFEPERSIADFNCETTGESCIAHGPMDKAALVAAAIADVEATLRRQRGANRQASEGATDSESRAESKWDTGGLEASYLARGYARQFEESAGRLQQLRNYRPVSFSDRPISQGALVQCDTGGQPFWIFLLDCGGLELNFEGREVTFISQYSPLGQALQNKREGDAFSVPGGISGTIRSVE